MVHNMITPDLVQQKIDELIALKQQLESGKATIANAITSKGVSTSQDAEFSTMATNIGKLKPSNYILPSGTKSISSNGTHDVTNYASISVNVPTSSSGGTLTWVGQDMGLSKSYSGLNDSYIYLCLTGNSNTDAYTYYSGTYLGHMTISGLGRITAYKSSGGSISASGNMHILGYVKKS